MLKEFREFALKGNLLELAVAFVLGLAFAAVVTSFVDDVIMQLVAAIIGKPDFSNLTFSIGDGVIRHGSFLTALVTFLIIACLMVRLFCPGRGCRNCGRAVGGGLDRSCLGWSEPGAFHWPGEPLSHLALGKDPYVPKDS
jgi:hypothetical protein